MWFVTLKKYGFHMFLIDNFSLTNSKTKSSVSKVIAEHKAVISVQI